MSRNCSLSCQFSTGDTCVSDTFIETPYGRHCCTFHLQINNNEHVYREIGAVYHFAVKTAFGLIYGEPCIGMNWTKNEEIEGGA